MKKLIFALMIIGFAFTSKAQNPAVTLSWSGHGNALDTVTNTGTKYASVQVTKTPKAFSIVVKVTKISGTVGGTISWQGSNNGTDYVTISTSSPSDASANYSYVIYTPTAYKFYRVSWTGSGTMSASISGVSYVTL